jgi:VanZ family protein
MKATKRTTMETTKRTTKERLRNLARSRQLMWAMRCEAVLVAVAIWILSAQSKLPELPGPLTIDKVQHLIAYAVLAAGVVFWFPATQWKQHRLRTMLVVVGIASLYGATDELHQYFVEGRESSVFDVVADTAGAVLTGFAAVAAVRWMLKKDDTNV